MLSKINLNILAGVVLAFFSFPANSQTTAETQGQCVIQALAGVEAAAYHTGYKEPCEPAYVEVTGPFQVSGKRQIYWKEDQFNAACTVAAELQNYSCGFNTLCSDTQADGIFSNTLEPAPQCQGGCEVEATTGGCSEVSGVVQCVFDAVTTGNICTPSNDPPPEVPPNCILSETGAIACDCSVTPDAGYCQTPPPPGDPPPNGCVLSGGVVYCVSAPPPPEPPNPEPPTDGGTPSNPSNPSNPPPGQLPPGTGPGDPGGNGPEAPCIPGVDCEDEFQTASTSGDCSNGPPSCEGPAIECATLVQIWRSNCALTDVGTISAPWEDDPDWGRDLKSEAEVVDGAGLMSGVGGNGSGSSCPATNTIAVMGLSIELDLQALCDYAHIIKFFVLLTAWIAAAYIISRAL